MKRKIFIITGPTASGKSSFAIELAKNHNGVIVNADSLQVYKEIPIISAQPQYNDGIEHFLYGVIDGQTNMSVGKWMDMLDETLKNVKHKTPIIVGGTAMYIYTLINGIANIPEISMETINKTQQILDKIGISGLYQKLKSLDAKAVINPNDTQRVCRAYSVIVETGKSIVEYSKENINKFSNYEFEKILIIKNKEELIKSCHERFMKMIELGAIEEVKNLLDKNYPNTATIKKAIGINPISRYLDNKISKEEMIDEVMIENRQYIKKQLTWFRNKFHDFDIH